MSKLKFSLQPETGTLSDKDAKKYFSAIGWAVFAFMLVYWVSSFAIGYVLSLFAPWIWENAWLSEVVSIVPLYGIAFPIFYILISRLPKDPLPSEHLGFKNFFGGLCVAFTLMSAGNYIGNFLILIFESISGRSLANPVQSMTEGNAWWINLIFMAIIPPILEEIVFRKILCGRLLPLGEGYTVIISGAIFGLVHGNFFQFFYAFFVGALFALIYIKTGKIIYTIIYHMILNVLGGVFAAWMLEKLDLEGLMAVMESGDIAALEAFVISHLLPILMFLAYEMIFFGFTVGGIVFLIVGRKKIRFRAGLLPPPKEGRAMLVFGNVGIAAAITLFAAIFVLSLVV